MASPGQYDPPDFRADDPEIAGKLGEALRRVGYDLRGLTQLHDAIPDAIQVNAQAALTRFTRGDEPIGVLTRLFLTDAPVESARAAAALAPLSIEEASRAGLLITSADDVRGAIRVRPYRAGDNEVLICHDRPAAAASDEFVLGPTDSGIFLAFATSLRTVDRLLDIGTGCGLQAFHGLGHAADVTGTDVNQRALRMTRLAARLAGCDERVELLSGSLTEPVEGRQFEQVVCNAPFVVSPEQLQTYLSGGNDEDEFSRRLSQSLPPVLAAGGIAQALISWVHRRGEDADERVESWFDGTGCDVWLARHETAPVTGYTRVWTGDHPDRHHGDPIERQVRWLDQFEAAGIEHVSMGLLTMRRRPYDGDGWFILTDHKLPERPAGDAVDRFFARQDWLDRDDNELLDGVLDVPVGVALSPGIVRDVDGWRTTGRTARLLDGFEITGDVTQLSALLFERCDGHRTLRDIATSVTGGDHSAAAPVVATARELVEVGLLVPAGWSSTACRSADGLRRAGRGARD